MNDQISNPETILIDEQPVRLDELLGEYKNLKADAADEKKRQKNKWLSMG